MPRESPETTKKYFIETSVARKLFAASKGYRKHITTLLADGKSYTSSYVRKEFCGGLIDVLISFYFSFKLPGVETIHDARSMWSDKWGRASKTILEFTDLVVGTYPFDTENPRHTGDFRKALAEYIWRLMARFDTEFTRIGANETGCSRALVPLEAADGDLEAAFIRFQHTFTDEKKRRSECHIETFVNARKNERIDHYIAAVPSCQKDRDADGFIRVCNNLANLRGQVASEFTCRKCAGIADAVIALEMPDGMQLQSLDKSFNYFCRFDGRDNRQIESQPAYFNRLEAEERESDKSPVPTRPDAAQHDTPDERAGSVDGAAG